MTNPQVIQGLISHTMEQVEAAELLLRKSTMNSQGDPMANLEFYQESIIENGYATVLYNYVYVTS